MNELTLSALADQLPGATLHGEDCSVTGINEAGRSDGSELEVWLDGPVDTDVPAVVDAELDVDNAPGYVSVEQLSDKLPVLLGLFEDPVPDAGISEDASVAEDFQSGEHVSIGPNTTIGPAVEVGNNVVIHANVSIRGRVTLGDDVTLRSGVRIESPATIGSGTTIHANTVVGSDGYGYEQEDGKHHKIPQVGKVVIGDNVEIGSGVTIDRAMFGETEIGSGTKIDNHVHIAHNNKIGNHCLLVAMAGLAGSVTLGDHVTLAAQTGVKDHVEIADGVTVGGRGGVTKDVEDEEVVVSGYPARPHRDMLKQKALIRKLPSLKKRLDELTKTVDSLTEETS